jgi:hypothetical protein
MQFRFSGELWEYEGEAPWVFVTLPTEVADEIAALVPERPGFGSVRVEVTVGSTTWRTSLFPDKVSASFVLPVKRQVRMREDLDIGQTVDVAILVAPD